MHPGAVIDQRFELERAVTAGGMGQIWRARDRLTGRPVAIKVMLGDDGTAHARFGREAALLADIRHPGVVEYVAHGSHAGAPYLAMEWLDGVDLAARSRATRIDAFATVEMRPTQPGGEAELAGDADGGVPAGLPAAEVLVLARRLASALGEVHGRGVVHRDLKPETVFLLDADLTRAKLSVFGVARGAEAAALTADGVVIGTPHYMAPEQVRGDVVTAATDVWGLGAVLYELFAGRPPFTGSHPLAVMARIVVDEPPPLGELRVDLPAELTELIHAMLAKEPGQRPRTGRLAEAFERLGGTLAGALAAAPAPLVAPGALKAQITGSEARIRALLFARRDGGEAAAGLLDELRAAAASRGGEFERVGAGERSFLITVAGAASPRDQATRMAAIALALRRLEPTLAIAIVTGRGSESAHHTPIGEVVDRAAALLDRVTPGEIEIDRLTAGLLEGRYQVETVGERSRLTGAQLAEQARTLLGRPSRWVGRRRELTTLLGTFDECVEGPAARALVVLGQAGMGKSRLRHELLRALHERGDDALVLHGHGDSVAAGAPFHLLAPAVRAELAVGDDPALAPARLAARLAQVLPSAQARRIAPFLGELIGVRVEAVDDAAVEAARGDPMLMGEQVRAAFAAWLRAEARRPVVLTIEDLHWGDLPSVNAIDVALRELHDRPFLVVATARPEVRELFPKLWASRGVVEVALHALAPRACAEIATDALGAQATPEVIDALVARCEGNAFYLEELIRAVVDGGGDLGALPATVVGTVQARLAALDGEARRVLRAAAVFGEVFAVPGVASVLGGGSGVFELGEWIDDLTRRELIQPDRAEPGALRFRHALIRDAAYDMLTEDDRRIGHRLAAQWLERIGRREPLTLAAHYERGGEAAAAVRWYHAAVDDAVEGNDLAAVEERGERAVAAGASGAVLGAVRCQQAIAAYWRSDYAAADRHGEAALALLAVGSVDWFRAAGAAIVAAARLGDYAAVDRRFEAALAAPCAPDAVAAQLICLCRGTFQLVFNGRLARADEILARIAAIHGAGAVDALTTAQVEHVAGVRWAHVGDVGRFLRHLQAAVDAFERAGDVRNVSLERTTVAWCWAELGELARAAAIGRDNLARCQALRAPQAITYAKVNLGYILALDPAARAEGTAILDDAIAECRAVGNTRLEGWARAHRATARLADGDAAAALTDATAATAALAAAPGLQAWARAVGARAQVALGDAPAAIAEARAAIAVIDRLGGLLQGETTPPLALIEALRAAGDVDGAAAAARDAQARLAARAARLGDPAWQASFLTLADNQRTLALAAELAASG